MNDVVWLNSDRVEKLRLRRRALAVIERHVRQSVAHALESVRAPWLFGLWRAERIARDVLERQAFCYAVNVIEFALLRAAPS